MTEKQVIKRLNRTFLIHYLCLDWTIKHFNDKECCVFNTELDEERVFSIKELAKAKHIEFYEVQKFCDEIGMFNKI